MPVLPPFPAPTATYSAAAMAPKVGWHSAPVLCPLRELWPPLEKHSVAKREVPRRQPVTVPAAFQVKDLSQAECRRERQAQGKAGRAAVMVDPMTDPLWDPDNPWAGINH